MRKSEPVFSEQMICLLISLTIMCEILIVAANVENGQNFERKYHGIPNELAAYFIGSFVVDSKIKCGLECDRQNCGLMHYSTASKSCNLYNKYMSDDQPAIDGLYAKIGTVDISITCPPLPAPDHGSVGTNGNISGTSTWYWCDHGFNRIGDETRICGNDGTWSGSQPTCAPYWTVTAKIEVSNGEHFGVWGHDEFCANGTYAYGYDLRIQPDSGLFDDDTALNAIKLHCKSLDWSQDGGSITSSEEYEGDWQGSEYCGHQHFMKSFSLQVEGKGLGDDTAANFVKFRCRDFASTIAVYEMAISPGYGLWGEYGSWSNDCGPYRAICGINTRVHPKGDFDETSLNDVIMFCC